MAVDPLSLPQNLGDGLRLRSATPLDADALAAFNGEIHADVPGQPDVAMADWTRDLLTRPHPTFRPDLFTIVEEVSSSRIASSLTLIPQTWSYDGVTFDVGRIELVGTHPDFRRRGLVRRQMDVAHRVSHDRSHLLQAITGIPWYYRQFGYEMALDLGGSRSVPVSELPTRDADEPEPYHLRPAGLDDIPLLLRADDHGRRHSLLSSVRDAAWWNYEIAGRRGAIAEWNRIWAIEPSGMTGRARAGAEVAPGVGSETAVGTGSAIGYVAVDSELRGGGLLVSACEAEPSASWITLAPSLLRALGAIGNRAAADADRTAGVSTGDPIPERRGHEVSSLVLRLGADHPLYDALPSRMQDVRPPYAWYVRVADLPDCSAASPPYSLPTSPRRPPPGTPANFAFGSSPRDFGSGSLLAG
jgi:GNAT superfamily N-acetyltransferase